ncbi:hypothetical protein B0H17DRAFT_1194829 [Mycena rosella]|uniref:Uncharacterized protein n=1 Tax=Mycena rosella TaxID=1033263 RepID=A0AAD7GN19_MYCRO|nr:hypothetical protein B0H17DRAFT_1194829 [Mycena rosella]
MPARMKTATPRPRPSPSEDALLMASIIDIFKPPTKTGEPTEKSTRGAFLQLLEWIASFAIRDVGVDTSLPERTQASKAPTARLSPSSGLGLKRINPDPPQCTTQPLMPRPREKFSTTYVQATHAPSLSSPHRRNATATSPYPQLVI